MVGAREHRRVRGCYMYLWDLGKILFLVWTNGVELFGRIYIAEILIKFSYEIIIRTSAFQAIHVHNMKQLNLSVIRTN